MVRTQEEYAAFCQAIEKSNQSFRRSHPTGTRRYVQANLAWREDFSKNLDTHSPNLHLENQADETI